MTADDEPSRSHIPPEIRAANRRRAREIAECAPDLSKNPKFRHWMQTVFLPRYFEVLEEQRQRDGSDAP